MNGYFVFDGQTRRCNKHSHGNADFAFRDLRKLNQLDRQKDYWSFWIYQFASIKVKFGKFEKAWIEL